MILHEKLIKHKILNSRDIWWWITWKKYEICLNRQKGVSCVGCMFSVHTYMHFNYDYLWLNFILFMSYKLQLCKYNPSFFALLCSCSASESFMPHEDIYYYYKFTDTLSRTRTYIHIQSKVIIIKYITKWLWLRFCMI